MAPPLLAASITPLRDGGATLDEAAIAPLARHLRDGGVDGIFCCGTTGEGVMMTLDERQRAAAAFRSACDGDLIVHCGAQTTADTVSLCQHAAAIDIHGDVHRTLPSTVGDASAVSISLAARRTARRMCSATVR